ncbi:MAG: sigma-70 family RNA polymerase sigma factor, partial [Lachnospiraceae bacterium]|nr:sigma-70 family RNA polymerase sigma factor [Lachnospiraceae bacterium]
MNKKQEEIFNEAYYNYSNLLLKIIRMYVKDSEESKDILQEVFYKLLVKEPKFESVEHEKRWLIRVAINQAKDYHKSFW